MKHRLLLLLLFVFTTSVAEVVSKTTSTDRDSLLLSHILFVGIKTEFRQSGLYIGVAHKEFP